MDIWRARKLGSIGVAVAMLLASVMLVTTPADAQEDRYETCAVYGLIIGSGGQTAADAAEVLRAIGAPNSFGVDNVLDVIVNGEADVPPLGSRPTADALAIAYEELDGYFGGVCADIDVCPLVRQAIATNDGPSANAAGLLRRIETPAPPGIDAALALIAGDIADSPFHDSVAEAQAQVASYFPCAAAPTPTPAPTPTAAPAPTVPAVPTDVAGTCGDLAVLSIPEGPRAIEAAQSLRSRGAPNPPGIEAALDTVVAAADFSTPSPALADVDAALATLASYFGGVCDSIDRCSFVAQISGADNAAAAQAAHDLRRIEAPAPPGIDAALALIAGDITESPFHSSVGEARQQVLDYYPCGDATSSGSGGGGELAFTGASSAALAALGAALVASGATVLRVRRRVTMAD